PDFVRVFYAAGGGGEAPGKLRKAAREEDTSFVMDGSDVEVRILAAGVLSSIVASGSSNKADAVALCLACMEVQGKRGRPRLQVVSDEAAAYCSEEAVRMRSLATDPVSGMKTGKVLESLTTLAPASDVNAAFASTATALKDLVKACTDHVDAINK